MNAIKYSHAGGKIAVSAELSFNEHIVSVCDSSLGLKVFLEQRCALN